MNLKMLCQAKSEGLRGIGKSWGSFNASIVAGSGRFVIRVDPGGSRDKKNSHNKNPLNGVGVL